MRRFFQLSFLLNFARPLLVGRAVWVVPVGSCRLVVPVGSCRLGRAGWGPFGPYFRGRWTRGCAYPGSRPFSRLFVCTISRMENGLNVRLCSPRCLIIATRSVPHARKTMGSRRDGDGGAMGGMRHKRARAEGGRMGACLSEYRPVQIAGATPIRNRACETPPGQKSVVMSTCANHAVLIRQKRASATSPVQKICRNIDLCKSPRRNLSEYRPVQTFQLHKSHFRPDFLSQGTRGALSQGQSVGISTCATLSVAQVAFSTDFFSRPS